MWVLNEMIKEMYAENMKKIMGAVWELPAKYPISTQIGLDWLCYLAGNSQTAPTIFFIFSGYFFKNYFIQNPQNHKWPHIFDT